MATKHVRLNLPTQNGSDMVKSWKNNANELQKSRFRATNSQNLHEHEANCHVRRLTPEEISMDYPPEHCLFLLKAVSHKPSGFYSLRYGDKTTMCQEREILYDYHHDQDRLRTR